MGRGTTGAPACWALREMRRAQSRWVLTLQQFRVNLGGSLRRSMYSPSLDLKPKDGADLPSLEAAVKIGALFNLANYDWNDPLSARSFEQWREQQVHRSEERRVGKECR